MSAVRTNSPVRDNRPVRGSVPLRGTQSLVGQMGWVSSRPTLTALEIAWRWAFGIPFLLVCWRQWLLILAKHPLDASGFTTLDKQNPWIATVQLANVWSYYQPPVFAVLRWLVPAAALAWVIISGLGRSLVLHRIDSHLRFRPMAMIVLQAVWLVFLGATFWLWFTCIRWVADAHINAGGEPDLIGYSIWAIVLSLAFFTAWALISWAISVAPLLLLLEDRSVLSSLAESLKLGREFTGKLAEINLVMGIVKLALIVLAMVFSAAPLPFSDELGPEAMRVVWMGATVFYLVANDYFHVVRLRGFMEFWRTYRGGDPRAA
jgi:hypothetical protein